MSTPRPRTVPSARFRKREDVVAPGGGVRGRGPRGRPTMPSLIRAWKVSVWRASPCIGSTDEVWVSSSMSRQVPPVASRSARRTSVNARRPHALAALSPLAARSPNRQTRRTIVASSALKPSGVSCGADDRAGAEQRVHPVRQGAPRPLGHRDVGRVQISHDLRRPSQPHPPPRAGGSGVGDDAGWPTRPVARSSPLGVSSTPQR